jgi:nucleotide sugar dehydrogenase
MTEVNLEDVSSVFLSESSTEIRKRMKSGELKIAIYGLGHVGSSIASVWLRAGAHVIGLDKSQSIVKNASNGITHIPEPGVNEAFSEGIREKRFKAFENESQIQQHCAFKIICVPVLSKDQKADLTAVEEVAKALALRLQKGDVIALNPSVPPGTTEEVLVPILEQKNIHSLRVEKDFYVIYNPERIYVGRAIEDIEQNYPAIVAGAGKLSLQIGIKLYSIVFNRGVRAMTNIRTAEAEKLFEGVYRDANIALANELAKICDRLGIDFWEVQTGANSQPFCHIHDPGIGVGGACIPVYPQFVLEAAKKVNAEGDLIRLARSINDDMPRYAVERAMALLGRHRKLGKHHLIITLLGLAFRGNVSDTRLSPTYSVINELKKYDVSEIRIHDPLVQRDPIVEKEENVVLYSDIKKAMAGADLVIVVANHSEYQSLNPDVIRNAVVYDGRRVLSDNFKHNKKVLYESLGMGL